jgi:hypothetical protein
LFISARTSRKSVSIIVGVGITHFVNQAGTLILVYLFADDPFPKYLEKVRSHFS